MNVGRFLIAMLLIPCVLQGKIEWGNKTYYTLRQYDSGIGREQSVWHAHTTNDIGNPHGLSVQIMPFITFNTDDKGMGKQLGLHTSNTVLVASDRSAISAETIFPYHAIHHDATGTATTETSATLTLKPSFTAAGAVISLFKDGKELHPGLSFQLSIPIVHVNINPKMSGGTSTVNKYFDGTYSQSTIQDALLYGMIKKDATTAIGPVTAQCGYNIVETNQSYVSLQIGLSIATFGDNNQKNLLSAHHINDGHHKIIVGFETGTLFYKRLDVSGELLFAARYSHLLPNTEKRIVGVFDDDGSTMVWSPYRLSGKKGQKGTFPFANILHQNVYIEYAHQIETNLMGALTYKNWIMNAGYGIFARQADSIRIKTWTENTYALANATYDTTATFEADTVDSQNRRYVTLDMLDRSAAESPAQIGLTFFIGGGYTSTASTYPFTCGAGISYEHNITHALPATISLWGKVSLSF